VLYESLAGTPPFHRDSEVAVLNAHLHAPPPRLAKAVPGVPSALEQVLGKALSKSPLDRYPTPGALIAAARAAVAERRSDRRKLVLSLLVLVLAALVGAAAALGVRALWSGGDHTSRPAPRSGPHAQPPFDLKQLLQLEDGHTLNDIAYVLIEVHRFQDALPFARKAYRRTPDNPVHAFATFNLGYVLLRLGQCRKAIPLFQSALPHEPPDQQPYVRNRIREAKRHCPRQ
jgi:tetratricopeptide (TPR) repeat protein